MNRLSTEHRALILVCLVEGMSMNSAARAVQVKPDTVARLVVRLGKACQKYQNQTLQKLSCTELQCDEIWSFVGAKQKNVTGKQRKSGWGDVWTWVAIDPKTKLVPCWHVGGREDEDATCFMRLLSEKVRGYVEITTDGLLAYSGAIASVFGDKVKHRVLMKTPAPAGSLIKSHVSGMDPEDEAEIDHASTSMIERQNLTIRMQMRRFTRKTNGHSKKLANHKHALALFFMYYNFGRVHMTLKTTPAMKAGIADHVWTLKEIVGLMD